MSSLQMLGATCRLVVVNSSHRGSKPASLLVVEVLALMPILSEEGLPTRTVVDL